MSLFVLWLVLLVVSLVVLLIVLPVVLLAGLRYRRKLMLPVLSGADKRHNCQRVGCGRL